MKLLALLTVLLLRRSATSESSEDVGACLLASHSKGSATAGHKAPRCDAQRDCAGVSFGDDRSCLDAAVPWLTPHAQVKCCFRCCLAYWQRELGLTEILEDWEADIRDHKVPNEAGVKKHGWPKWDDVVFSHMTPFAWASTRRMSGAFLPGSSLEGVKNTFETAASAKGRPGGFGMYEGGYPVGHHELDPSGSGSWPSVVVVGTDEWASPQGHKVAATGPVKEWYLSNPKELDPVPGACFGAPTKGGNDLHGALMAWLKEHPHCRPEVYYQQVSAETADSTSVLGHAFPRALQRTTGWDGLLDGREARDGSARKQQLFCGGSIKLRGARAEHLKILKHNGFPCVGKGHTGLDEFVATLQSSKFSWSPPGHGWSNHREWEILISGSVPVVEFHPNMLEVYRGLPVVQVVDWKNFTPAVLEQEWARIEANAASFNLNRIYWPYWLRRLTLHMERELPGAAAKRRPNGKPGALLAADASNNGGGGRRGGGSSGVGKKHTHSFALSSPPPEAVAGAGAVASSDSQPLPGKNSDQEARATSTTSLQQPVAFADTAPSSGGSSSSGTESSSAGGSGADLNYLRDNPFAHLDMGDFDAIGDEILA